MPRLIRFKLEPKLIKTSKEEEKNHDKHEESILALFLFALE